MNFEFLTMLLHIDRIPVALAGLILSLLLGLVALVVKGGASQPIYWQVMDSIFGRLGEKLNRKKRHTADLLFRSFVLLFLAVFCTALFLLVIHQVQQAVYVYGALDTMILALCFSSSATFVAIFRVFRALNTKKLVEGAYRSIANTLRVDLNSTDNYGVTRVSLGLLARSFDRFLVAPVFWYLIFGIFGLCFYSTLAALAWRFGRNGHCGVFGRLFLSLEALMSAVPSLLSGILFVIASILTPTVSAGRAMQGFLYGIKRAQGYHEGGAPLYTFAYALNVSIGGAIKDIEGHSMKCEWVGPSRASAQTTHQHLKRGLYLYSVAHIVMAACLAGGYVALSAL